MMNISIVKHAGSFAENKDIAQEIRLTKLIPALEKKERIVLDFEHVDGVTQSFIHALISDLIRRYGNDVLDCIQFKSCNETVRGMISIVTDYMQESE